MAESWSSIVGDLEPTCSEDLKSALAAAGKSGAIRFKNKSIHRRIARELWDAQGGDAIKVMTRFDTALGRGPWKAEGYLLKCCEPFEAPEKTPIPTTKNGVAESPENTNPEPSGFGSSSEITNQVDQGNYVFLYRHIRYHDYFSTRLPIVKLMFINLILDAAFKDHETDFKGEKIFLKRGQWAITIGDLALEYKVQRSTVQTWLKDLKNNEMIDLEPIISSLIGTKKNRTPRRTPDRTPRRTPGNIIGMLVTIRNYDKWQPCKQIENSHLRTPDRTPDRTPRRTHTEECITEEGKTEERTSAHAWGPITGTEVYRIWDEHKGPLDPVIARSSKSVYELVKTLNELHTNRDPREVWTEVVQKAATCHESHREFMMLNFFTKDPNRINQVIKGTFDKPFDGGGYGKRKATGKGRGSFGEFGIESKE